MQREAVEGEGVGEEERADQSREQDEAPAKASGEIRQTAAQAEAVAREGAALDQRHEVGAHGKNDEGEAVAEDGGSGRDLRGDAFDRLGQEMKMRDGEIRGHAQGNDDHEEDQEAPAGAQTVVAEEDAVENGAGWRRRSERRRSNIGGRDWIEGGVGGDGVEIGQRGRLLVRDRIRRW